MTIKQIRIGRDNFSYIINCPISKEAALVDPGYDADKLLDFISTNNLDLKFIINTHYHSDHSGQNQIIKKSIPSSKIVASESDGEKINADITVKDDDQLKLGKIILKFILTPGHTSGSICILVGNEALLTGDTLFIGDCGRTDLPGGSIDQMYKTLHEKIVSLPDHLIVYPGHDYGSKSFDTLGNQKKTNNTLLAKSLNEFSKIP